ncbi:MAG: putative toxin-antitoxin system toxin component, PIN family [Burkholderiales bacterium]
MRLVLDTNVVASALLWGGTPERLIQAAEDGGLEFFTSEALIAELAGILQRTKFAARLAQLNSSPAEVVARYREIADTVEASPIEESALRDPDDAAVLACALAARADAIVSGDDDLHALGTFQGIPVLSPAQLLQRIAANG